MITRQSPTMASPIRLTEATIRDYLKRGVWQPVTLSDYWDRNASRNALGTAVTNGEKSVSWGEAKVWIDRVSLALIRLGLARDDLLVIQIPNDVELPLMRVACEKAGVLSLPLPCTLRQHEMSYCLRQTEAPAVLVAGGYRGFDHCAMMQALQQELPRLYHILVSGKDVPAGVVALEEISSCPQEERESPAAQKGRRYQATEVSIINATTGSTGLLKFAEYSAAARLLFGRSYVDVLELNGQDVLAALSPAAGGPNIPVYFAAPQVGAKAVFLEHFDAEAAFMLIQQERVTVACLVPAQLALMVRQPHYSRYDFSSVRFWLSVGASLSANLAQEAEEKLGGKVLNCYGAVDWGGVVFTSPLDHPKVRNLTVGIPRAGTEVRLVDEQGRPVDREQLGEIEGRGPSCSSGYYRDPESTRKAWTSDGWLPLGDLAQWDSCGNLIVIGRKDDLIIRGAQNIMPIDIENHLLTHPKIKQAAVIGMSDSVLGQRICAYIVLRSPAPPTLKEIASFLISRGIAPYKIPERIEVVARLPMVSNTKVDKKALQSDIAKKLGRGL
ncbi:MAG: AMP-binding protein [Dehalococcoidia bacterium]|nr:AMP-binding protein [Dehalococcoidia bacterium]